MTVYQHRFDRVEDYLHHRAPYLLIDRIVAIEPERVVTRRLVRPDDFFIQGHFPGAAVLPGAMMQEMMTQSAGVLIAAEHNPMSEYNTHDPRFNEYALGVLVRVSNARYRGFSRPGEELIISAHLRERIDNLFDFVGKVNAGEKTIARAEFQLTNIPSSVLIGDGDKVEIPENAGVATS